MLIKLHVFNEVVNDLSQTQILLSFIVILMKLHVCIEVINDLSQTQILYKHILQYSKIILTILPCG